MKIIEGKAMSDRSEFIVSVKQKLWEHISLSDVFGQAGINIPLTDQQQRRATVALTEDEKNTLQETGRVWVESIIEHKPV